MNVQIFEIIMMVLCLPVALLLVYSIIKLFNFKHELNKTGISYFKTVNKKKQTFWVMLFGVTLAGIILMLILDPTTRESWYQQVFPVSVTVTALTNMLSNQIHGNISGIFDKGIMENNRLYGWEKIHSYKIDKSSVFAYLKNGQVLQFNNLSNLNQIDELFEKNEILKSE